MEKDILIEDQIKASSALEVANNIRSKVWTAKQVMQTMIQLTKQAHELTNSVVLLKEEEALKAAQLLDKEIECGTNFPEKEYPFLGVPISVKDFFNVKGWPTCGGYRKMANAKQEEDAVIVAIMRKLGCIPYCKTNVPQFGLSTETSNPVSGITTNPFNPNYTCGGSSGGEGALIGAYGSILGIGSDIGGSLRVPASFCGIYSFKPTPGRFPIVGHMVVMSGQDSINTSSGPMGKSVEDIDAMFRYVIKSQPWKVDFASTKTPYEQFNISKNQKYKIGYTVNNQLFPSSPACERAVLEVVELLKEQDHNVFEFDLPGATNAYTLASSILLADGLVNAKRYLGWFEPLTALTAPVVRTLQIPTFIVKGITFVLNNVFGQKTLSDILNVSVLPSVSKLWNYQEKKNDLGKEAHDAWTKTGEDDGRQMDILLCPVTALPPQKHNTFMMISPSLWPCMIFNLINYPSGVIPVTKVDADLDRMDDMNQWLKEKLPKDINTGTWAQKLCYSFYDSKEMAGLPIGIQVVGKKAEDEKVLEFMKYIDGLIKNHKK